MDIQDFLPTSLVEYDVDGKSLKVSNVTTALPLSNEQVLTFAAAIKLLDNGLERENRGLPELADEEDDKLFNYLIQNSSLSVGMPGIPIVDDVAYKFTTPDVRDYLKNGSVRLNTVTAYHDVDNLEARDGLEGFTSIHMFDDDRSVWINALASNHVRTLCLTTNIDNRTEKHRRFGPILFKINRVAELAKKLADAAGATSYGIKDVEYSHLRACSYPYPELSKIAIDIENGMTLPAAFGPKAPVLMSILSNAACFIKSANYKIESERRMIFDFLSDQSGPLDLQDASFAEHFEEVA